MARHTRFEVRLMPNLTATAGQDRLQGGDGVMTGLRPNGAYSISLLAIKPVRVSRHLSRPNSGDGADAAQTAAAQDSTNTTTTQEVSQ